MEVIFAILASATIQTSVLNAAHDMGKGCKPESMVEHARPSVFVCRVIKDPLEEQHTKLGVTYHLR